jgi:UrcA family protein
MYKTLFARSTKQLMIAAAGGLVGGLLIGNVPVVAQPLEEITVVAPYHVEHKVVGRSSSTGAPIETISLSRPVSYSDLDLSKPIDVTVLENRVKQVAKESCKELEKIYPDLMYTPSPSNQNCLKSATEEAMDQVRKATYAAQRRK